MLDKGLTSDVGMDEVSADGELRQAPHSDVYRKTWGRPGGLLSIMPFNRNGNTSHASHQAPLVDLVSTICTARQRGHRKYGIHGLSQAPLIESPPEIHFENMM